MIVLEFMAQGDLLSFLLSKKDTEKNDKKDRYANTTDLEAQPIQELEVIDLLLFALDVSKGLEHLCAKKVRGVIFFQSLILG